MQAAGDVGTQISRHPDSANQAFIHHHDAMQWTSGFTFDSPAFEPKSARAFLEGLYAINKTGALVGRASFVDGIQGLIEGSSFLRREDGQSMLFEV